MDGYTLTGIEIDHYRLKTLLNGLRMEYKHNMRMTAKAPTCYSIIKREFGLKGNKEKVYNQFCNMLVDAGVISAGAE